MSDLESWGLPEQQSLPELLEARIVSAIRSGELRAGERIVETVLAKKLQVSRGPLREALKALEANRLVSTVRGKGTYVAEVSRDDLVRMMGTRAVLEGFAARLVSVRCVQEPEVVAQLVASLEALEAAERRSDPQLLRDVDWQFHELVCVLADNPFLLATWRTISSLVRLYQQSNTNYEVHTKLVVNHHRAFLDVLRAGDPEVAERTFRRIITETAFAWLAMPIPESIRSMAEDAAVSPARKIR